MIYKPPMNIAKRDFTKKYVFLGGSISANPEMTELAEDWQKVMTDFFISEGWGVFNPRRDEWDASWHQSMKNPEFFQQVNWELNALDNSDLILMNFIPNTISPISLYEFGRYSQSNKISVVCPDGYFRKGNIEIGCYKDNIPLFDLLDEFKPHFIKIKNNI